MSIRQVGILGAILLLSLLVRLYKLDTIPFGLNIDEASMGYNAYSLLQTGKDRYGEAFPVIFRSFGSFQAPLYTYFTVPAIFLFGANIFAVHLVSALSGFIVVCATFLIGYLGLKQNFRQTIVITIVVAFTPWSILFTRFATEASLGLALFVFSIPFFILSLRKIYFFIPASFFLGLATHAYYSERVISVIFFIGFIFLFLKKLLMNKKWLICGICVFVATLLPHMAIFGSGAFSRRLEQVNYFSEATFLEQGGNLRNFPFGKSMYIAREFSSQYLAYFSPRNLFFDPDPQGARSIPDLSVFYSWMVTPFFIGIYYLFKKRSLPINKILILVVLISPIPASLTRDPFYTIRTLDYLWSISFIIGIGIYNLLTKIHYFYFKVGLILTFLFFSITIFYVSYFVLFKYERAENFGYSYIKLFEFIEQNKNFSQKNFVIDTSRELGAGVRMAFLKKYDPLKLQQTLKPKVGNMYYGSVEFVEEYALDNIEVRPIFWKGDVYKEQILVGDSLAISEGQIKEHKLKLEFEIKDLTDRVSLKGYSTNPKEKQESDRMKNIF